MFAFMPLGGSVVNFTEFWSTETGKYEAGIEVKNNLKSSWIVSLFSANSNTIFSREGIQDAAK